MYRKYYWYRSSITKIRQLGLKNIFEDSLKHVKLNKNDVVLDIGANDGTLLSYYKKRKFKTIGCEPAKNLHKFLEKKTDFSIRNFWSKKELDKVPITYNKINQDISSVEFDIDNQFEVAGFQFWIEDTPNLLETIAISTTERSEGFTLEFNEQADGTAILVGFDLYLAI